MKTKTLYKIDSKGKTRVWKIGVVVLGEKVKIKIYSGILDGKLVLTEIPITSGKNLDKSNSTTPYTQALSEIQSKIDSQLRSGYVEDINNAKQFTLGSGIPKPMLAQKYHPNGEQKGSKTLEKMGISKHDEIHVQPKLDGNRCLIKIEKYKATMYTRNGDIMPVQLEHISKRIEEIYDLFLHHNFKTMILDGELFSEELSFNELNGHLKRKENQDREQLVKIKYYLYDIMADAPYNDRYDFLRLFPNDHIILIPSFQIKATDENIKNKLDEFLFQRYEGLMIRILDIPYENKRSWSLCKYKIFEDDEFEIVDLELDSLGRLGAFVVKLNEPTKNRDGKTIRTFKAGITKLSHEEGL